MERNLRSRSINAKDTQENHLFGASTQELGVESAPGAQNVASAGAEAENTTVLPSRPSSQSSPNLGSETSNPPGPMVIDSHTDPNVNTPDSPVEWSEPGHYEIVPDGDLTLELCEDFTVSVSSAVLSQASPRLSIRIERWLKEAAATASPPIQELHEEEHYAMYRLLCLLHRRPDPMSQSRLIDVKDEDLADALVRTTDPLLQLAILTDKYQCHEALELVSETLLSDFAFPSARDAVSFSQAAQIAAAAYLLRQPRYFRLFTKRLVTDHTEAFETLELPLEIPFEQSALIRSELEYQSSKSFTHNLYIIEEHSRDRCVENGSNCEDPQPEDALFLKRIASCVLTPDDEWPAKRSDGITLRHLLHSLYHLERIQRVLWCIHDRVRTYGSVGPENFVMLCTRIDDLFVTGVCLTCTEEGRECNCFSTAEHANAARWVAKDSFLFGAGPAHRNRSEHGLTGRDWSLEVSELDWLSWMCHGLKRTRRLERLAKSPTVRT